MENRLMADGDTSADAMTMAVLHLIRGLTGGRANIGAGDKPIIERQIGDLLHAVADLHDIRAGANQVVAGRMPAPVFPFSQWDRSEQVEPADVWRFIRIVSGQLLSWEWTDPAAAEESFACLEKIGRVYSAAALEPRASYEMSPSSAAWAVRLDSLRNAARGGGRPKTREAASTTMASARTAPWIGATASALARRRVGAAVTPVQAKRRVGTAGTPVQAKRRASSAGTSARVQQKAKPSGASARANRRAGAVGATARPKSAAKASPVSAATPNPVQRKRISAPPLNQELHVRIGAKVYQGVWE
jgi:hypothetical protein